MNEQLLSNTWHVVSAVGAALGIPALALAWYSAWLSRRDQERLTRLQSGLVVLENESKERFNWLHKKRAAAIVDLYALVVDLETATRALLGELTHGTPDQDRKEKILEQATNAGTSFQDHYAKLAIFFEDDVLVQLESLNQLLYKKRIMARVFGREQTIEDRLTLATESEWRAVSAQIKTLRRSLQQYLGVVTG